MHSVIFGAGVKKIGQASRYYFQKICEHLFDEGLFLEGCGRQKIPPLFDGPP
jgi:hypothetical protein